MTDLQILALFCCLVPCLSIQYLEGQVIPQYYLPYVLRSEVPRPVPRPIPRSTIMSPELARLYAAKKQAIKIAKDIDSEIEHYVQNQLYRRTFDTNDMNFPFFNPRPTNPLSAAIGAQGGVWFPGPSGAGVEGSRMLEGRANQVPPFRRAQASRTPSESRLARILQVPQNVGNTQVPRTFTPTGTQSTPDPSDEINSLGNPTEFDQKCMVLKLTFEKSNGDLVFDDSLQKNNGRLQGEAQVLKDHADQGRSVDFGNNGKIVLKPGFKGKPKKSIAISLWVKLKNVQGVIPLITATDERNFVRYGLQLRNGRGEWVHRGDSGRELFRIQSSTPDVTAEKWHNIVGSFDSMSRTASLWVDGKQVSKEDGINGVLSQKWNKLTIFGGKARGDMDNVFMFRCPLDKTKIVALYVSAASPKEVKRDLIPRPK